MIVVSNKLNNSEDGINKINYRDGDISGNILKDKAKNDSKEKLDDKGDKDHDNTSKYKEEDSYKLDDTDYGDGGSERISEGEKFIKKASETKLSCVGKFTYLISGQREVYRFFFIILLFYQRQMNIVSK